MSQASTTSTWPTCTTFHVSVRPAARQSARHHAPRAPPGHTTVLRKPSQGQRPCKWSFQHVLFPERVNLRTASYRQRQPNYPEQINCRIVGVTSQTDNRCEPEEWNVSCQASAQGDTHTKCQAQFIVRHMRTPVPAWHFHTQDLVSSILAQWSPGHGYGVTGFWSRRHPACCCPCRPC